MTSARLLGFLEKITYAMRSQDCINYWLILKNWMGLKYPCAFTTYRGVHGLNVLPSRFEAHGFKFGTLLDAKKSKSRTLTKLDAPQTCPKSHSSE